MTHDDYKEKLKNEGVRIGDDECHQDIMKYAHKDLVETQGNPMLFSFRKSDSLESKCGKWSVQVDQAISDTKDKQGNVGLNLYERNLSPNPAHNQGIWKKVNWFNISQSDFVELLRHGKCPAINLLG